MLETLCRKLTLLFGLLTAAVLGAALAVTCRMAQNEARAASDLLYANTISSIEDTVTGSGLVRDSWLARLEAEGRLVITMEDNGLPLAFPGGCAPADDRAALLAALSGQDRAVLELDAALRRGEPVDPEAASRLLFAFCRDALRRAQALLP